MRILKVNGKVNYIALIIAILIPQLLGFASAYFSRDAYAMFDELVKPDFAPPGWIFAPVWAILYTLMGVASYRVWMKRKENDDVKEALTWYGVQLIFNFLWTILFFTVGLRGIALIEILILLVLIIITAVKFYGIDKIAGYLFIPYILWVAFAAILNFSIWFLNK